ncbi:MAG: acyl-CoA thioesterase [Candidatus Thermoplasmatota archaeon]|nr:acyl-CoA thioesterase [Candidatus Thermoplasmatota archaeon]
MTTEKKSWRKSRAELQRIVLPADTNVLIDLYGGRLVEWIDNLAAIVAVKHANGRAVTGSIDSLFFLSPIRMGDVVRMEGRVTYVTRSTMEIEVNVFTDDPQTDETRFTTTAYLTYVAIDQNGKPREIPGLLLENDEDRQMFKEGEARSKLRKKNLKRVREEHRNID